MLRGLPVILLGCLTACAVPNNADLSQRRANFDAILPPMKVFAPQRHAPPGGTNAELARDFLELSFAMESGRALPVFSRFEGPITVRLTGTNQSASLAADFEALLDRLRREAGIDITQVPADQAANITVETIPRRQLQRILPQAACFVVPNATNWDDFRASRRSNAHDWAALSTRSTAAIFLPGDVAPQEMRDCLHEELAQALGPLNDLYRLNNSVFNDDNFHTVLTGFDMLMLRVTYAPELTSGMARDQVARRLPVILSRLNPHARSRGIANAIETPRLWIDEVERALAPNTGRARRLRAAERALVIARSRGWTDTRLAFSHFLLARLSLGQEGDLALSSFFHAATIYGNSDDTAIQAAHVGMQLAAFSLSAGEPGAALEISNDHLRVVARSENAALLATLLLIKAEALDLLDRNSEAEIVRGEGLGWARYGFGNADDVARRLFEIASLAPTGPRGTPG